jgi:ubiquinone biosynthesis protein UbiJ
MATSSPFSLLNDLVDKLTNLQPPIWVIGEAQHRLVLLLNHVLMQEPEATARLARHKGRVVSVQWRTLSMRVIDLAANHSAADLTLLVTEDSPVSLVQTVLVGGKPSINIEGDVQLAAEMNWLVDHVRWDVEEDLSRIVGDAPAHAIASMAKQIVVGLKSFLVTKVADTDSKNQSTGNQSIKAGS